MTQLPRRWTRTTAALAIVGVAACGGTPTSPARPRAAEPSVAPSLTTAPAGRVLDLPAGSLPEGVVADPVTHTVVVGMRNPDRLALIDSRTLKVRIIASPGHGRHLVLAQPGGPVLLPAELRNALYQLALPSGRVETSTLLPDHPHNAAVVGRDVWVADEFAPAVSVVGPAGRVIRTLHGPTQPGGVVTAAGTVGVTDVKASRLYFYDARSFASEGSIALGAGPTHAEPIGNRYAVATDTRGGALLLVDLLARRVVSRLALPGGPYGMASDPSSGRAWVTLTATNQLVAVTRVGDRLRIDRRTPTVRQPNTVAVDPHSGCLYVVGVSPAALEVICS